jgi:hypothetical protein
MCQGTVSSTLHLGSFYIETEACGTDTRSAEYLAAWYKSKVINVLRPEQWWRVNSLATDMYLQYYTESTYQGMALIHNICSSSPVTCMGYSYSLKILWRRFLIIEY